MDINVRLNLRRYTEPIVIAYLDACDRDAWSRRDNEPLKKKEDFERQSHSKFRSDKISR